MKQTSLVTIILSLLFFALFVFVNLTLFISQFSHSFSHLFLIFIREDQLFNHLSTLLFFCGFVLSVSFVIIGSWKDSGNIPQKIIMLVLSTAFMYLMVLNCSHTPETQDIVDMFAIEGSIYHRGFFELLKDYSLRIILVICAYVFFVYLPLLFMILNIKPDENSELGKILYDMRPSINIVIIMLFALALQPYYYRDNLYVYLDIFALLVGIGMLIYVSRKHKEIFGFYEHINFGLLILGIIICLICSSILAVSDNSFNARYTFLIFAFVGWCIEWMYNNTQNSDNQQ